MFMLQRQLRHATGMFIKSFKPRGPYINSLFKETSFEYKSLDSIPYQAIFLCVIIDLNEK